MHEIKSLSDLRKGIRTDQNKLHIFQVRVVDKHLPV